ncbi:unnamed protein product, partial [Owenia fusiformis]
HMTLKMAFIIDKILNKFSANLFNLFKKFLRAEIESGDGNVPNRFKEILKTLSSWLKEHEKAPKPVPVLLQESVLTGVQGLNSNTASLTSAIETMMSMVSAMQHVMSSLLDPQALSTAVSNVSQSDAMNTFKESLTPIISEVKSGLNESRSTMKAIQITAVHLEKLSKYAKIFLKTFSTYLFVMTMLQVYNKTEFDSMVLKGRVLLWVRKILLFSVFMSVIFSPFWILR